MTSTAIKESTAVGEKVLHQVISNKTDLQELNEKMQELTKVMELTQRGRHCIACSCFSEEE
jgi:hypothetical protein